MNKDNYGSPAACQRLVDARIVLTSDMMWATKNGCAPQLILTEEVGKTGGLTIIPAVNFAEVWRELPSSVGENALLHLSKIKNQTHADYSSNWGWKIKFWTNDTNPCDVLIDLLIWVRKEGNNGNR